MVRNIENSIPDAESTVEESQGVEAPLDKIYEELKNSLDPVNLQ